MSRFIVHHGDALDVLRTIETASAHSLVTDPPAGIAFMNAEWDKDKGGRANWVAWLASVLVEARRVLKPGSHGLVWSLPRTSHWTATAIEDAGFEVRDRISHFFATGFPKSKSLLKPGCEDWWLIRAPGPLKPLNIDACRIGTSKNVPGSLSKVTGLDGYGERRGRHGQSLEDGGHNPNVGRWPANVTLEHAAGCERIGTKLVRGSHDGGLPVKRGASMGYNGDAAGSIGAGFSGPDGREEVEAWHCAPGCPVAELDAQSGERRSAGLYPSASNSDGDRAVYGRGLGRQGALYEDAGGASRFYFCAKPSVGERIENVGKNKHPTVKPLTLLRWLVRLVTPTGGLVLDPFTGSGTTGVAALQEGFDFLGVEREAEYVELARGRIGNALGTLFAGTIGEVSR